MSDLISRESAYATVLAMYVRCDGDIEGYRDLMCESILVLPSVQPEITRCKDCEYYELTEWVAHRCNLLGRSVYGNDFCAWAEPYKGEKNE